MGTKTGILVVGDAGSGRLANVSLESISKACALAADIGGDKGFGDQARQEFDDIGRGDLADANDPSRRLQGEVTSEDGQAAHDDALCLRQ